MNDIKIVKTLPHLIPLLIPKEGITVYSNSFSTDIVRFLENLRVFKTNNFTFTKFKKYISQYPSKKDKVEEVLDYSIKGDVASFWPIGYRHPIRIEFFGEDVEKIYSFDEVYGRKQKDVKTLVLSEYIIEERGDIESIHIHGDHENSEIERYIFVPSIHNLPENVTHEIISTDFQYPQLFYSKFDLLKREIENLSRNGYKAQIKTKNNDDLPDKLVSFTKSLKLDDFDLKVYKNLGENLSTTYISAGLVSEKLKLAIFTDRELFGAIYLSGPEKVKGGTSNLKRLLRQFEGSIQIGDFVVHEDYGIGIYAGLTMEEVDGEMLEYLLLKYDKDDELYVPIHQIKKITKYIGNEGSAPRITRLGKASWEAIKSRVKKSTEILARELVEHYAKREVSKARPIKDYDSKDYKHFVEEFKYIETDDQIRSINEVIDDLTKDKPMNRLLVGDVGFGKTEVFMRAAFKIVETGGQVAVLSPTTILTAQHYAVFKERFKSFPFRIEYLSRFNTPEQNKKIIDEVNEGKVDIVIGTHRLLSSDVKFKNLQLVVVDEEQRFGVKQKEKIKQLNYGVHLLSVSATPIPRTLSMALSSIQSISIISQPPKERKSVHTELVKNNWDKVIKAISYEVERGGQVYFLHNQVETIVAIKNKLEDLLPGVKFVYAHGQMRPNVLDKVMTEFYEKKYDCLVCTTIIENGLDLPNVNTMIINNSQRFGLSQLYQLRGRVGRSNREAYCYLLYEGEKVTNEKVHLEIDIPKKNQRKKTYLERLQTLVDNQDLGAGFRIASRDLEIRGAGNLLGEQQSGHISSVGYALYVQILSQEVERLRNIF